MLIGLRTLVLNSNYMPISLFPMHTIPAEDAVCRIFSGSCHPVFNYNRKILTPTLDMNWPSVIARNEMLRLRENVKLRRESLFYRDHGLCAYCEKPLTISGVTYDHVHPKTHGGQHVWDNVVAACIHCNLKKDNSLPKGEWKPRIKPYHPTYWQLLLQRKKFPITIPDDSWTHFLGDWEADIVIRKA